MPGHMTVVNEKRGLPTGLISALIVVQLGKRLSVLSTLQQNRSPPMGKSITTFHQGGGTH